MDESALAKARGNVITRFVNIECVVNAIICQHYLGKVIMNFYLEVLYDPLFTFGLKRSILEKIIPDLDKSQVERLGRLSNIRNYFAHTGPCMVLGEIPPTSDQKEYTPDPRKLSKVIDYDALYQEFLSIEPEVWTYLAGSFAKMGGQIVPGNPDQ